MTQISFIVNSMPRDLTEFAFFLAVGFTAGSMGLIWFSKKFYLIVNKFLNIILSYGYHLTSKKMIFYKGYADFPIYNSEDSAVMNLAKEIFLTTL